MSGPNSTSVEGRRSLIWSDIGPATMQKAYIGAGMISWPAIVVSLIAYATLCSSLRFRRLKRVRRSYGFHDRASLSRMTNKQAQQIFSMITTLEFPLMYDFALRFALIRTYAVENVAKLLMSVSDLSKASEAPKRYADTEALYACFAKYPPDSPLLHKAVARMNYLHNPYIKSGRILNKDLLYVLWASAAEPERFMRLYEWRSLEDFEVAASFQLWKYIGDLMGIDYKAELGKEQWADSLEFKDDLKIWAQKYEDDYLRPFPEVQKLGTVLFAMTLSSYPKYARPLGWQVTLVLLGDRLRHAFGLPEPGIGVSALAHTLLLVRQFFMRYLALPRSSPYDTISIPDDKTNRIHLHHYLKEPWYTPSTIFSRWNPEALLTWVSGGILPGDNALFKPEGFLFSDLGPKNTIGEGIDENTRLEAQIRDQSYAGCPFAVGPGQRP